MVLLSFEHDLDEKVKLPKSYILPFDAAKALS